MIQVNPARDVAPDDALVPLVGRCLGSGFPRHDEPARRLGRIITGLEDFEAGDVYQHPFGRTISETDNTWFTVAMMSSARWASVSATAC